MVRAASAPRNTGSTDGTLQAYGLRALTSVVFDIDLGQRLDGVYPTDGSLSDDACQSIAHLALPHSNKQDEGDTQFIVRLRVEKDSSEFLFGFVLFRQQRAASQSRGYFQRALVIVTSKPFVDLYDRVLRVAGPLFFQAGCPVLEAVYESIAQWPPLEKDTPLTLPLAGTYISCVIPDLLDYNYTDMSMQTSVQTPSPCGHFIADHEDASDAENCDDEILNDAHSDNGSQDESEVRQLNEDKRHDVIVEDGRFVLTRALHPPSPSFGDVLKAKRHRQSTAFESVGLYSSFMGIESCLWQMWQFAITGESLVILSPHARTCSQATLAFTSLIAPLRFEGDYRPYYALYEVDFDEVSSRQGHGMSSPEHTTVIGTTNPFFMKSFKRWPNALIFPFLEQTDKSSPRIRSVATLLHDGEADADFLSVRIKPTVDLDTVEDTDRALLFRRRPRYLNPDVTVLNQLVSPPEIHVTQTSSTDEEPFVAINNAILRRHFRKLTQRFLAPFDQYFGVWKSSSTNSNLYMSVEEALKPFDAKSFLASVNPRKLPPQIKRSKWRALYTAFIQSRHFEPWFSYRRRLCIHQLSETLRTLRLGVTPAMLLTSPCGELLSLDQCEALEEEIIVALEREKSLAQDANGDDAVGEQVRLIDGHLAAVRKRIQELLG